MSGRTLMFGKMPLNYELQLLILVTALGKAYNTLAVAHIEQLLDDDIKYESQQVLSPLKGREAVLLIERRDSMVYLAFTVR